MFARVVSCALRGLAGVPVSVEADVVDGLPSFTVVGLTDRAVQEARERVRAALRNSGLGFPQKRITVNLAPAELPKEGTAFDLAIAVALLVATGSELRTEGVALLGELALDGGLRPVPGVLPMAMALRAAGCATLLVPADNAAEAARVDGVVAPAARTLGECVAHLEGSRPLAPVVAAQAPPENASGPDLAEVRGHGHARRALEIAAAGGHNVLMTGPPGSGKTMLAHCLPGLLPDLGADHALEVASIYSVRGAFADRAPGSRRPPMRSPHHTVSRAGLVGGGSRLAAPGEISLAHRGVLFLDEVCEFSRPLLECLRQPMEERRVTVVRSGGAVTFPAAFQLVAAANPCPCGHLGDPAHACTCDEGRVTAYAARLSGPLRDRIDVTITVPRQRFGDLFGDDGAVESSAPVRRRVEDARARQRRRGRLNAELAGRALSAATRPTTGAMSLLASASERLALSARAVHRVLRVARTIADLAGEERVDAGAVAEALCLRGDPAG